MGHTFLGIVQRMSATMSFACILLWVGLGAEAQTLPTATGNVDGHEYVDLGLSVWWATCNVGATKATGYGDSFGWGETAKKAEYTPDNSTTYQKPGHGDILGSPDYDAARAQWGERWRLPTKDELQELVDSCNWRWATISGVQGYMVTSRVNGKQIFLPAAGVGNGTAVDGRGEDGYYWTATPFGSDRACSLGFYRGHKDVNWHPRYYGRSIRGVTTGQVVAAATKPDEPTAQEVAQEAAASQGAGTTGTTARRRPTGALRDEVAVAQVKGSALTNEAIHEQIEYNGHAFVDLGLSVRWATTNIGADYPLDDGDYFAWGDTITKDFYGPGNCKTLGKKEIDGWVVRDITTREGYDAARAQWGEAWRMPTLAEMEELVNNCDWIFQQTNNGRSYYIVKGPKPDSQIILPLGGHFYGIEPANINQNGFYWTSTADRKAMNGYNYAYYLYLSEDRLNISMDERDIGRPIRPVTSY